MIMRSQYILEACRAAQQDLQLERVEQISGIDLSAERAVAQEQVKSLSRKLDCYEAISHYRKKRRWVGGPSVPERIRDGSRAARNHRPEQLVKIVGEKFGWSDEAWA